MSPALPRLSDFGTEPDTDLLSLLRALAHTTAPDAAALGLIGRALEGRAERGTERLLPMLADHPAAERLPTEQQSTLRAHAMKARARFVAQEAVAREIIRTLAGADVPALLLKGIALATSVYDRPWHRPMGDLDIAVPPSDFETARGLLVGKGFAQVEQADGPASPRLGLTAHALTFRNEARRTSIDLHYNVLNCSLWARADEWFWREARPVAWAELAPALTLAPEHHLVHACLHGYSRSVLQLSIRWMLDAHFLVTRSADSFRWELVEAEGERQRCGPLLAATLGYLAQHLGTAVPAPVLARLADQPMPEYDRAFFRDVAAFQDRYGFWRRIRMSWNGAQRQAGQAFRTPWPYAVALSRRWGSQSPTRLVLTALSRLGQPAYLRSKHKRAAKAD